VQKLFDELIREFAQGAFEGQGAQMAACCGETPMDTGRSPDPITSLAANVESLVNEHS